MRSRGSNHRLATGSGSYGSAFSSRVSALFLAMFTTMCWDSMMNNTAEIKILFTKNPNRIHVFD